MYQRFVQVDISNFPSNYKRGILPADTICQHNFPQGRSAMRIQSIRRGLKVKKKNSKINNRD